MSQCPVCGKNFEAHAVAGRQEGLRLGDPAICIGCGTYLILEALPYEMRLMSEREFHAFDPETQLLLVRASAEIKNPQREKAPATTDIKVLPRKTKTSETSKTNSGPQ